MKNPRHQFVLLGFLAQGLVWDSWIALLAYTLLWIVCLKFLRGRVTVTLRTEALVLLFGCIFSYLVGKLFSRTTHFFLGEGLIFLQAVRLVRPLNRKEKLTSLLIACFHFGVVCTLAPNIRFVLLFLGAAALFPKALQTLQLEEFDDESAFHSALRWPEYVAVLGISVALFFTLPRFFTGAPIFAGAGEPSLLHTVLDPSQGGSQNSDRVLLQIEGEKIGYLRCYSLTEFDGVRWNIEKNAPLRKLRIPTADEYPHLLKRSVRVKNGAALGSVLPTDGNVRWLQGNFFTRPMENTSTIIEVGVMWNTANNTYDYFVDTNAFVERLSPAASQKLTSHPAQSERLKAWLRKAEGEESDPIKKARAVERLLRNSYSYKLGTPELNRLNPVEDFIFNRTEGHCERFAAAMGLFLRMEGVPSRVVIGYVATTHNPFTGWRQVRFKDAHAWTEGYFDELGWVQFDATPGPPAGGTGTGWREMLEALDFAWYSHVVNFDGFAQKQFFASLPGTLTSFVDSLKAHQRKVMWVVGVLVAGLIALRAPGFKKQRVGLGRKTPGVIVAHHYGKMLQLLAHHGYYREPSETPREFLQSLQNENFPHLAQARFVTDSFCRTAYGGKQPASNEIHQVEDTLHQLKQALRQKRN